MMDIPEKSKRDEKSKYRPRRNWLFIVIAGFLCTTLLAGGVVLLAVLNTERISDEGWCAYSCASAEAHNAAVSVQLTETALAAVVTDDMADIEASSAAAQQTQTTDAIHFMETATTVALTLNAAADTPFPRDLTLTAIARATAAPTQCGLYWTTDVQPEATQMLQSALNDAGLNDVVATAYLDSERERCQVDGLGTPVALAGLLHLSFYTASAPDTPEARGALIERLLTAFQPLDYRGAQYIQVTFGQTNTPGTGWYMTFGDAFTALKEGKRGADLYEAGRIS